LNHKVPPWLYGAGGLAGSPEEARMGAMALREAGSSKLQKWTPKQRHMRVLPLF
jgi:hypothetical protein